MRILSNFDTKLADTLKKEYASEFWVDKVIVVHKSKMYFYQYIGLPFIAFGLFLIGWAYALYMSFDVVPYEAEIAFWACMLIFFLFTMKRTSAGWMNYSMDFMIITPKEVMKYDQSWVFWRDTESIRSHTIKSIIVHKKWIVQSFLDIGDIEFLAEWDTEDGDIIMNYVDWITAVNKKVRHVLGLDTAE